MFVKASSLCLLYVERDADPTSGRAKANPNQRAVKTPHILGQCWQGTGAGLAERGRSADSITDEAIRTLLAVLSCCVPLAALQGKETER